MDTMNQLMTPATITEPLDRLEAAEKERDELRKAVVYWQEQKEPGAAGWRAIARRLRTKIEAMEKQKPLGDALLCVRCNTPFDGNYHCPKCGHPTATQRKVYALPGAKGE